MTQMNAQFEYILLINCKEYWCIHSTLDAVLSIQRIQAWHKILHTLSVVLPHSSWIQTNFIKNKKVRYIVCDYWVSTFNKDITQLVLNNRIRDTHNLISPRLTNQRRGHTKAPGAEPHFIEARQGSHTNTGNVITSLELSSADKRLSEMCFFRSHSKLFSRCVVPALGSHN